MTESAYTALCEFCRVELDIRKPGVFQHASGWVQNRTGGGAHGLSLPERDSRWACHWCVEGLSRGTLAQTTLFGGRDAQ